MSSAPKITLENVSPAELARAWRKNARIKTAGGWFRITEHLGADGRCGCGNENHLYRCYSCDALCCAGNGASESAECDDCVIDAKVSALETLIELDPPRTDCEQCDGQGWLVSADGDVERCDTCKHFEDDDAAMAHVETLRTKGDQ